MITIPASRYIYFLSITQNSLSASYLLSHTLGAIISHTSYSAPLFYSKSVFRNNPVVLRNNLSSIIRGHSCCCWESIFETRDQIGIRYIQIKCLDFYTIPMTSQNILTNYLVNTSLYLYFHNLSLISLF